MKHPLILQPTEVELIAEYLEEIEAVIDADDGTLIPLPLVVKHEEIKELFYDC